jgi:hypothetical protein
MGIHSLRVGLGPAVIPSPAPLRRQDGDLRHHLPVTKLPGPICQCQTGQKVTASSSDKPTVGWLPT